MTDNQKKLLDALTIIANATLTLEDAQGITKKMTKKQVREIVNKFSKTITEFDVNDLFQSAYDFEGYSNNVITDVAEKLEIDY